jgi:hypothetical protein
LVTIVVVDVVFVDEDSDDGATLIFVDDELVANISILEDVAIRELNEKIGIFASFVSLTSVRPTTTLRHCITFSNITPWHHIKYKKTLEKSM